MLKPLMLIHSVVFAVLVATLYFYKMKIKIVSYQGQQRVIKSTTAAQCDIFTNINL